MKTALVLLRHDLRIDDNPAFFDACENYESVIVAFLHSPTDTLLNDNQKWWLSVSLKRLNEQLAEYGGSLYFATGPSVYGMALDAIQACSADAVFYNRRYGPDQSAADEQLRHELEARGVAVVVCQGKSVCEPGELLTGKGEPYKVFTAFWKQVVARGVFPVCGTPRLSALRSISSPCSIDNLFSAQVPDLAHMWEPGQKHARKKEDAFFAQIESYGDGRDYPGKKNVSFLSPHIRFGEISLRSLISRALDNGSQGAHTFAKECGWNLFGTYLLQHFPDQMHSGFRPFGRALWKEEVSSQLLDAWREGRTGYPLVDAGMRELVATGYMHNRVRMVTASFLVKHLLVHWKEGEAFFAQHLLDYDPAQNLMNWQWVAGTGVDASPFFRVFNPELQGKKFDEYGKYVLAWCPELKGVPARWIHTPYKMPSRMLADAGIALKGQYPRPIVDHSVARKRALALYQKARALL